MSFDRFLAQLRTLNADPSLLSTLDPAERRAVLDALCEVRRALSGTNENTDAESRIEQFIKRYKNAKLPKPRASPALRGMFPKSVTVPPKEILNDAVLMTLDRLEQFV